MDFNESMAINKKYKHDKGKHSVDCNKSTTKESTTWIVMKVW